MVGLSHESAALVQQVDEDSVVGVRGRLSPPDEGDGEGLARLYLSNGEIVSHQGDGLTEAGADGEGDVLGKRLNRAEGHEVQQHQFGGRFAGGKPGCEGLTAVAVDSGVECDYGRHLGVGSKGQHVAVAVDDAGLPESRREVAPPRIAVHPRDGFHTTPQDLDEGDEVLLWRL